MKKFLAIALLSAAAAGCTSVNPDTGKRELDIAKILAAAVCASEALGNGIITVEQYRALGPNPDPLEVAKLLQSKAASGLPVTKACLPMLNNAVDRVQ